MVDVVQSRLVQAALEEVRAPKGWTALLLRQRLPIDDAVELTRYREAVSLLLNRLPAFSEPHPEETFLDFGRCRADKEIPVFRANARFWMPEFGVGVRLDQEPPTTWTTDEFVEAAPGTLRPMINRFVRVSRIPAAQASAWRLLLGSGALLRVSSTSAETFLAGATAVLQPTIVDPSLTSFPFYIPVLQASTIHAPSPAYDQPLDDHLPTVNAYLRESVEDSGLVVIVRQTPEAFWQNLLRTPLALDVSRITPLES